MAGSRRRRSPGTRATGSLHRVEPLGTLRIESAEGGVRVSAAAPLRRGGPARRGRARHPDAAARRRPDRVPGGRARRGPAPGARSGRVRRRAHPRRRLAVRGRGEGDLRHQHHLAPGGRRPSTASRRSDPAARSPAPPTCCARARTGCGPRRAWATGRPPSWRPRGRRSTAPSPRSSADSAAGDADRTEAGLLGGWPASDPPPPGFLLLLMGHYDRPSIDSATLRVGVARVVRRAPPDARARCSGGSRRPAATPAWCWRGPRCAPGSARSGSSA